MCDIWSGITDVSVHLPHDADMLVAVEESVLFVLCRAGAGRRSRWTTAAHLVRLEAGVGKHHDQALGVLVCGGNGYMLGGDQLRKLRWWQRWH